MTHSGIGAEAQVRLCNGIGFISHIAYTLIHGIPLGEQVMNLEHGREEITFIRNTSAAVRSSSGPEALASDLIPGSSSSPSGGNGGSGAVREVGGGGFGSFGGDVAPWAGAVEEGDPPLLAPLTDGGGDSAASALGPRTSSGGTGGGQAALLGMIRTLSNRIHDGVEVREGLSSD